MEEETCCICIETDYIENFITTPCNHLFHKECLNKIIRPYCPLCKKNLTKFLIRNGISKKEILKRVELDEYQILHTSVTDTDKFEEYDSDDLAMIAILAKKINNDRRLRLRNWASRASRNRLMRRLGRRRSQIRSGSSVFPAGVQR